MNEFIGAWMYGPIVPSIFYEFRDFGASRISRLATDFNPLTVCWDHVPKIDADDKATKKLLARVWKVYKGYSTSQLLGMTHAAGGPWSQTRSEHPGIKNAPIPNELLRRFFIEKMNEKD